MAPPRHPRHLSPALQRSPLNPHANQPRPPSLPSSPSPPNQGRVAAQARGAARVDAAGPRRTPTRIAPTGIARLKVGRDNWQWQLARSPCGWGGGSGSGSGGGGGGVICGLTPTAYVAAGRRLLCLGALLGCGAAERKTPEVWQQFWPLDTPWRFSLRQRLTPTCVYCSCFCQPGVSIPSTCQRVTAANRQGPREEESSTACSGTAVFLTMLLPISMRAYTPSGTRAYTPSGTCSTCSGCFTQLLHSAASPLPGI